jgi:YidC/Oxa1 family membrane protein insertase
MERGAGAGSPPDGSRGVILSTPAVTIPSPDGPRDFMTPERRWILAGLLVVLFLIGYERLFPPPKIRPGLHGADSVAAMQQGAAPASPGSPSSSVTPAAPTPVASAAVGREVSGQPSAAQAAVPETLTVTTPSTIVSFTNIAAAPVSVTMRDYHATARTVSEQAKSSLVRLARPGETLLSYALVAPPDTIALDHVAFHGTKTTTPDGLPRVEFQGDAPRRGGGTAHVDIAYTFDRDGYLARVGGSVTGLAGASPSYLLIALPSGFPSFEADTTDDIRQLGYSFKPLRDDASSVSFSHLEPDKPELHPGPLTWVAAKDKYFLIGLLAIDTLRTHQFAELDLMGAPKVGGAAERAAGAVLLPLWPAPANTAAAGSANTGAAMFAFEMYGGPQDYRRLRALGRGFENLNPYGGIFHVIFQPFVTLVVLAILGLRGLLQINYGWILIIFGVVTRILLWPLNQRAMRTSLKMQRLQPEIQAVQSKYKDDQPRMQQELMRVYREHGMSPWSPIAGCLPMLLPWPIFAALYFVFRTTIEFRGVPFLWMHDISVKDPYYIMPVLMGLTMFLVSWIGMRNMPPNPQTKMMAYMLPLTMMFFFWQIAGGLNLYYFVQNLATIPQQWYLSNERAKAGTAEVKPKPGARSSGKLAPG